MPTLFGERDRDAMVRRLRTLTPQHQRRWGKTTVHQMLCHVSDQLRVAPGDLPTKQYGAFLSGRAHDDQPALALTESPAQREPPVTR